MTTKTFEIVEVSELDAVVAAVRKVVGERDDSRAAVVALHGDLGAGKTTFMQQLAKSYGVAEVVTSPTFVVMKQYEVGDQALDLLVHIDAYRLESEAELSVLGFSELLRLPKTLICIEWAEKVAALLPEETIHLSFSIADATRVITFDYGQEK